MSRKRSNVNESVSFSKLLRIIKDKSTKIHFIGIGGVSMYSLARLMLAEGLSVSGSDREESDRTKNLSALGVNIALGHSEDNSKDKDLVVYTHGISADNPELLAARSLNIPCINRAEFMGALMMKFRRRIGISGTHGKSTTTAMLDCIFFSEDQMPTVLSGADLPFGEPFRIGSDDLMIYEACEYKDSFLCFFPTVAVALNLEHDHPDYFKDINALKKSFVKALSRATDFALISGDDENLLAIASEIKTRVLTFGYGASNNYRYEIIAYKEIGFSFRIFKDGYPIGDFELNIPGEFNLSNATAAIAVALESGLSAGTIAERLANYHGIERRLQYVGNRQGRAVYYDYAHHPTEIAASINALKMMTRAPLTVIFKPHTYTRTESLWDRMCSSLSLADYLILTDIYPAREDPIEGVTSKRLAEQIGNGAIYCSDEDVLIALDIYTRGAIVIMGAGDLLEIKNKVINEFE